MAGWHTQEGEGNVVPLHSMKAYSVIISTYY